MLTWLAARACCCCCSALWDMSSFLTITCFTCVLSVSVFTRVDLYASILTQHRKIKIKLHQQYSDSKSFGKRGSVRSYVYHQFPLECGLALQIKSYFFPPAATQRGNEKDICVPATSKSVTWLKPKQGQTKIGCFKRPVQFLKPRPRWC